MVRVSFGFMFAMLLSCGGSDNASPGQCTDSDRDGYYAKTSGCQQAIYDCDDKNAAIHPGAVEVTGNGIDENCDGKDEPADSCTDADNDGAFAKSATCTKEPVDCDDSDPAIKPGATEICGNGIDEDCDGADPKCNPKCTDADGDGYGDGPACKGTDCDDKNAGVHKGAKEVCGNGIDEDCDGKDLDCAKDCHDVDGDGYGDGTACKDKDCDDYDAKVHPGATEICGNKSDEDCDGKDLECTKKCTDQDGDGYGDGPDCKATDCNDFNPAIHPGAADVCGNLVDEDCDGKDKECPAECKDGDGDGYGEGAACKDKDCDDTDANVHPGAAETCGNGKDEDCDGKDKPCEFCKDEDGDGYGEGTLCDGPDCDDGNPKVNPEGIEVCGNKIDEDCDGKDKECPPECKDGDGDGYGAGDGCKGPDCNDLDADIHPGANDLCGNGVDEDCDGKDAECPEKTCKKDSDCDVGQVCDLSTSKCRTPTVVEWWAPRIFVDVHSKALKDNKLWDLFTKFDFDGDWVGTNNDANVDKYGKPAVVYTSVVRTSTHYFVGYYLYFPVRWSVSWGGLGSPQIDAENAMQGILLVLERDGSPFGKPIMMETTSEGTFRQYKFGNVSLSGGIQTMDGQVKFDTTGHHPIVYVDAETHAIYGGGKDWDTKGFDGGDGVQYAFAYQAGTPTDTTGKTATSYALVSLDSTLWAKRGDISTAGKPFGAFGKFACDDHCKNTSVAPWRFRDVNDTYAMAGEFLFDPADHCKRMFSQGWGQYSLGYEINPYVVKVILEDIEIVTDLDSSLPWGKGSDIYILLYMNDGTGADIPVLAQPGASPYNGGYQGSFSKDDVPAGTILDLGVEMGRNYFYGVRVPGLGHTFGIEIRDADVDFDDWQMNPKERKYYDFSGTKFLDWELSNSYVTVVESIGI